MSGTSLQAFPLILPNPEWSTSTTSYRVNSSLAFTYTSQFSTLQTLSVSGASPGSEITGLLYVPVLNHTDSCLDASAPYVPKNVTRRANLPHTTTNQYVAIAPWLSPDCVQQYLATARQDHIRAFVFFLPDNGTSQPPGKEDSIWALGDAGAWKTDNRFPVYAIPGSDGLFLTNELAKYSGNMTDVPNGNDLIETGYDPRDYVRVYVDIDTG